MALLFKLFAGLLLAATTAFGCAGDGPESTGTTDVSADAVTDTTALGDAPEADSAVADGDDPVGTTTDASGNTTTDASADVPVTTDAARTADGQPGPTKTWDMQLITDVSTANCTFKKTDNIVLDNVLLNTFEVSYMSWESIGGELKPIKIRGFAARPQNVQGKRPGIVQAHGLGGHAKLSDAAGVASRTGSFVIAYTGPGGGDAANNTSEGLPAGHDEGKRMFDTIPDVRGSWFWGHTVAGMRALTCLAHHAEVDPEKLGMTGYSAGGVATWLAAGQDSRIKAAVPLSATLAWDEATKSPDAWQHVLLKKAGYTVQSPRWKKLIAELIDPAVAWTNAGAKVFLVNGSTDEFFPLTADAKTFDTLNAINGDHNRAIVANFDHGCYAISGVESAKKIAERADMAAKGAQRAWFASHFKIDKAYSSIHDMWASMQQVGAATWVGATAPAYNTDLWALADARLWWSTDGGLVYGDIQLKCSTPSNTFKCDVTTVLPPENAMVWFVTFEFARKDPLSPHHFLISTKPHLPAASFVPKIRTMTTCFPGGFTPPSWP